MWFMGSGYLQEVQPEVWLPETAEPGSNCGNSLFSYSKTADSEKTMLGLETSLCSFGPTDAHPEQTKTVTNKIVLMAGVKGVTHPVSHSLAVSTDLFAIRFIWSISLLSVISNYTVARKNFLILGAVPLPNKPPRFPEAALLSSNHWPSCAYGPVFWAR
jgi:hypothetical protein